MRELSRGAAGLAAFVLFGFGSGVGCGSSAPRSATPPRSVAAYDVDVAECGGAGTGSRTAHVEGQPEGEPRAREAAQLGLGFLSRDTVAWQGSHNCYGCHVQAVTLDAMIVGRRHHYEVSDGEMTEVLRGLLDLPGGGHGPVGFSVQNDPNHLVETSRSFGGAALAEYDEHVGSEHQAVLLQTAEQLLEHQSQDGSVISSDHRPPVVAGLMQSTTQAARTWRQAHARTADDRWLLPIARAETYIRTRAAQLTDEDATYLQDLSYGIIGLLAAGASAREQVVRTLATELRERQNEDGGWGFRPSEPSDAFATGQSVYVLKRLGATESDAAVQRGTSWLVEHQRPDGGWSEGGDRRGEAMWAVLGLVSIDVLAIDVARLVDGSHVTGRLTVSARATSTRGAAVSSVELRLDDVPFRRVCAARARATIDAAGLASGAHQLDVLATDARGQTSRRRITFYTGDHYITQIGTRYEGGSTRLSLRNIAPRALANRVRFTVYASREEDGAHVRGERVYSATETGVEGPMAFAWDGRAEGGAVARIGRYVATLDFVDAEGRVRQSVEVPFVHDTEEAQAEQFGQVAGRIDFDEADVEGAAVELVDERGRVVQRATTTRSGQYRFENLDRGSYRVRVRREGFRASEAAVEASPAASTAADLSLSAE